jgi:23S rRNA (uracil1939-C5)-methyltransferase
MPTRSSSPLLELQIDRAVAGGRMLARHEGQVVLVAGAIPGERVRARIDRVSRQTTWATVVEVLDASPDRRDPICDPACGGSAYAHVQYERQRVLKGEIIADAFRRIGKITLDAPVSVAASPEQGYRLRARLHIRDRRAGFFRENTHALCEAGPTGQLLPETMAAVDATIAALDRRSEECDEFVVAENVAATERVLHVVPREGARLDDLRGRVVCPAGLTGLSTGARRRLVTIDGATSVTDTSDQLFSAGGPSPIPPAVWSRRPLSFFQGNRFLTGALVRRVLELGAGDRFMDLYAGVGLFAVALAARGGRGLAVESDEGSGADLTANARPWGERLRVMLGSVEEAVALPLDPAPDLVVLDPPRVGMSAAALAGVVAWAAPRLIYVSCDPPTLARDAARLLAAGYRMESVDGFDLFPNTPHVEAVAAFARA